VAGGLFGATWACFVALTTLSGRPSADLSHLGPVLSVSTLVLALVLVTLSVAHAQLTGVRPRAVVWVVAALGVAQTGGVLTLGPAGGLWPVGGRLFSLIGFAVPLAWVASAFQNGARGQQADLRSFLMEASAQEARDDARQTMRATHRHDVRSMLFVVDGATRALGDPTLSADERADFAAMAIEAVERLGGLFDVHPEAVAPFDLAAAVRAVTHAERKAGRTVLSAVPVGLRTVGRMEDIVAVLRSLVASVADAESGAVQIRAETDGPGVVVTVEPVTAGPPGGAPANCSEVGLWSIKVGHVSDVREMTDLCIAVRLLADHGVDLWTSGTGGSDFALRLPYANSPAEVTA
jgi:hypothetical protein